MSENYHRVLLSIGTIDDDLNATNRLKKVVTTFKTMWRGVETTPILVNPDVTSDSHVDNPTFYTNQLVRFSTNDAYQEVLKKTKLTEQVCGREEKLIDIDILSYDNKHYHEKDWSRSYIKTLLKQSFSSFVLFLVATLFFVSYTVNTYGQNNETDKEFFAKAIEYFGGQKYQEALLTFKKIEVSHRLSTRMQAYKGVCLFKTLQYEDAVKTLNPVVDKMRDYSPHEQAVYYYALGESNFQLGKYFESIPYFLNACKVSNESDRAEICYRLGFSQMMCGEYEESIRWYTEAENWYDKAGGDELTNAHREQARHMLKALIVKTDKYSQKEETADSTQNKKTVETIQK